MKILNKTFSQKSFLQIALRLTIKFDDVLYIQYMWSNRIMLCISVQKYIIQYHNIEITVVIYTVAYNCVAWYK